MRAPVDTIAAPLFPRNLPWVNTPAGGQVSIIQRDRPLLVEFWDFCRPNSMRTLPYVKAWHERYAEDGLRVVGVHCPGFALSREEGAVRQAVVRLGIEYPVLIDSELELWHEYENEGWPARYLFDGGARLFEYHFGEGGYEETERAIQELLGVERETLAPLRPEDVPGAALAPPTVEQPGAYSGPYEAGAVWAVLGGTGIVRVNGGSAPGGSELNVEQPGAYVLIEHERNTTGVLELELEEGVQCLATCFTPGVAG
ncbi:MAG TPA: DipZ protein [Solirubrobacteraceae bacterium]|nr:DipZ protein [Solirubrobacteraceae bacterium]